MWLDSLLVAVILFLGECQGCRPAPTNTGPSITCPSVLYDQVNDPRQHTATVRWNLPHASDKEDGDITKKVTRIIGSPPGSVFNAHHVHTVKYIVSDSKGSTASCQFTFKVRVIKCPVSNTLSPRNGKSSCTGNRFNGDVCRYSCNPGYTLQGSDVSKCNEFRLWDKAVPRCKSKSCGALPKPPNTLTPPFVCDRGYNYSSVCLLNCDQSQGFIPTQGLTTRCTAAGSWSTTSFTCTDIEAPEFSNCPTQTIHQTSESGSSKTSVKWPLIAAVDNSNQLQSITASTGATLIGGHFKDGTHIVRFDVKDRAGNMAEPCMFIVKIERVECDPPDFQGEYIRTRCTPPFEEGDNCKVECRLAIKLNGSDVITCRKSSNDSTGVGFWDWGQHGTPPKHKPFCQVATCPKLPVPEHGSLTCDEWSGGDICSILCNANYDVVGDSAPTNFKPNYICLRNKGEWNQKYIPECSEPTIGEDIRMEAAYIFHGPCATAIDEIKNKFIQMMQSHTFCSDPNCKVENVKVVCPKTKRFVDIILSRQRKRATFSFVKFTLVKKTDDHHNSSLTAKQISNETVSFLKQTMLAVKQNGTFVVSGNVIKASRLRIRPPFPVCPNGYVRGRNSKTLCVACPKGMFHNSTKLWCQVCPVGQYQDAAGTSQCKDCPVGQSTLSVGSTAITQCLEECPFGNWSKTGFVPCVACPKDTYKSTQGSGHCTPCLAGTKTDDKGADSSTKCKSNDMLLQGPVMVNASVMASNDTCTMTFSVWAKLIANKGQGLRFEIYRQQEGVSFSLDLKRKKELAINSSRKQMTNIQSTASNLIVFVDDGWTHIAVVMTTEAYTVYKNGERYLNVAGGSGSCPIPQQSTLRVNVSKRTYVFLQDLNVIASSEHVPVSSLSASCSSNIRTSIFSLQHLNMRTMDRVLEVSPSSCLKDDACKSKPCGYHVCIVRSIDDGFRCLCRGGYSGTRCEIAPDHCKNNQCATGSTCIADVKTGMYSCVCPPDVIGKLCDERIIEGEWSRWSEWGDCSKSCSKGISTRERVCESPNRTYKQCQGNSIESRGCQIRSCPVCRTDDLKPGKGSTIVSCSGDASSLKCTIKCEEGLVYKEKPVEYSCLKGEWTPDRFTQPCTAPITPMSVGVKYCVVYKLNYTRTYVRDHLQNIGSSFQCAKLERCRLSITVNDCRTSPLCAEHEGKIIGCLTLSKTIQPGLLNISTSQIPRTVRPLLDTWKVLKHESTDQFIPEYRPLELAVNGSETMVYPHSHRDQAVTVTGKFGQILATWNDLDMANSEVRRQRYSGFNIRIPGSQNLMEETYLDVEQELECPERTVPGGLFCLKCAPGTYFFESTCQPCAQGFFQDEEGRLECKPCPEDTSTSILGASRMSMCSDISVEYS